MKAFRFPLERVLQWRRTQLELERAVTERLMQQQGELERAERTLANDRVVAEHSIAHAGVFSSQDLQTLSAYQGRTARELIALGERKLALQRETEAQLAKMMEAQRRVKLMERLREQRLSEWKRDSDAAEEAFASEIWLGRWPMLEKGDCKPAPAIPPRSRLGSAVL